MPQLFTNNADTTLAVAISAASLSITVAVGDGAKFPSPTGADFFNIALFKSAGGIESQMEIVRVTARAGDALTIVRAQEGTAAGAYAIADRISLRYTALPANAAESHIANMSNPHGTTKATLVLGNVDNTSDVNKPISTAQAAANALQQPLAGKDASGGYAGLTLFALNLRNALNTITSFFTTASTAARTWTLPDKSGTVAMTSDITGTNSGTNTGDQSLVGFAALGANTFTAAQNWATGANIASAATINLDTATGNRIHITGVAAISAVTLTRGPRTVIFDGVLTLTHNATTNNLPGGASITTAVNDRAVYESDGTTVYCVSYTRASGIAVVGAGALVLLATVTPTASAANVDFLNIFSATYDNYQIEIDRIGPTTDAPLFMRFAVAGVADSSTAYTTVADVAGTFTATGFVLTPIDVSNSSGTSISIKVKNVNSLNFKSIHASVVTLTPTNYNRNSGGAAYASGSAVSGFRLFFSGNNFRAVGAIRIYGLQN